MAADDPKSIVLAYQEAFYRNDRPAVRKLLADKGNFIGPLNSFTDTEAFLDSASIFMKLVKKTEIKKIFVDGNQVCLLYDMTTLVPSIPTLPIASWFKIEQGKINFFQVHFDPGAFVKAKEKGELAKALQ
jgi:limonene-1,2-epoxide hydrolase